MIAELLASRKDQLAFAKTCRAFQDPAFRMLYAHVEIRMLDAGSDLILATLFHRPDIARHIRSYSGPLKISIYQEDPVWKKMNKLGSSPVEPEAAPEGYFPMIFKHAKRIRELEILYHIPLTVGEQTSAIIRQLPLAKLGFRQDIETMSYNKLMIGLARMWRPELVKDIWVWNMGHLAGKNCPNLRRLSCPVELAKVLVPGLPISSVMINLLDGGTIDDELWAKLAQSSAGVLKLDILPWSPYQNLGRAAIYLPGVRHLRLREYRFDINEVGKNTARYPNFEPHFLIWGSFTGREWCQLFPSAVYLGSRYRKRTAQPGNPQSRAGGRRFLGSL